MGRIRMAGGHGDDRLMQRLQLTVWPDSPKEYRNVDRWPDSPAREKLAEVFELLADIEPSAATRNCYATKAVPEILSAPAVAPRHN